MFQLIKWCYSAGYLAFCGMVALFVYEAIISNKRNGKMGWVHDMNMLRLTVWKPITYRLLMGMAAFCFFDLAMLCGEKLFVESDSSEVFLNLPNGVLGLGLGLLFWKGAEPQKISVDLESRTFLATVGWPLMSQTLTGRLDSSGEVKAFGESIVLLQPNSSQKPLMIGALLSGMSSINIADGVSEAIGLPVRIVGIRRPF